ncbi:MAG: AAA family ATPase, partial [Chloroflexi bacterium]|nr:AAA family ATPase [Chloroflexota bacterium]
MKSTPDQRRRLLVDFLRGQRAPVSAAEISSKFDVTERTIFRDLTELRNRGVEIVGSPSHGGGISLVSWEPGTNTSSTAKSETRSPGLRNRRHGNPHTPAFVGRDKEFSQLRATLDRARSGIGQVVLLSGDPGIGKSRLAQEFATEATALGMLVARGKCLEDEGAPPYWPWIQVFRQIGSMPDFPGWASTDGGLTRIASAIPELAHLAPFSESNADESPAEAEFRLWDAMASAVNSVAAWRPLMLVLEDLHWADQPSLKLFEFVASELGTSPALLVATSRNFDSGNESGIEATVASLVRSEHYFGLELPPLSLEESALLLTNVAGSDAPSSLVDVIYGLTEGNPFFTVQVARLLAQQGDLSEVRDIEVPDAVRAVITRRLDSLSVRCVHVLTIAAILGSEFGFDELQFAVGEVSDRELLAIIDESLQFHVIIESPQALEHYQFAHALIRRVLSDSVSSSQRARYHAQAAAALEHLYGAQADDHAARLARHFIQAGSVGDQSKLAHYSQKAGDRALASYALEKALGHYEIALMADQREPKVRQSAEIHYAKGRIENWLGNGKQAVESLNHAFDIFLKIGDIDSAVGAVSVGIVTEAGKLPELVNFHSRGLELTRPGSVASARLLIEYGHALTSDGMDYEGAVRAFEQAIKIAEREKDVRLLAHALLNLSMAQAVHTPNVELAAATMSRVRRLLRGRDEPESEFSANAMTVTYLFSLGRLKEIKPHLERLELNIRESRWFGFGPKFQFARTSATLALFEGRWDDSRKSGEEFSDLASNPLRAGHVALVDLLTDDPAAVVDNCLSTISGRDFRIAEELDIGLALALAEAGRLTGDQRAFEAIDDWAMLVMGDPHTFQAERIVDGMLGLVAAARNDVESAAVLAQPLGEMKGKMQLNFGPGGTDRILGLLAGTTGRFDDSAEHFEDALNICRRSGAMPWLAFAIHDYVYTLVQRAQPADRPNVASLTEEGLTICD